VAASNSGRGEIRGIKRCRSSCASLIDEGARSGRHRRTARLSARSFPPGSRRGHRDPGDQAPERPVGRPHAQPAAPRSSPVAIGLPVQGVLPAGGASARAAYTSASRLRGTGTIAIGSSAQSARWRRDRLWRTGSLWCSSLASDDGTSTSVPTVSAALASCAGGRSRVIRELSTRSGGCWVVEQDLLLLQGIFHA